MICFLTIVEITRKGYSHPNPNNALKGVSIGGLKSPFRSIPCHTLWMRGHSQYRRVRVSSSPHLAQAGDWDIPMCIKEGLLQYFLWTKSMQKDWSFADVSWPFFGKQDFHSWSEMVCPVSTSQLLLLPSGIGIFWSWSSYRYREGLCSLFSFPRSHTTPLTHHLTSELEQRRPFLGDWFKDLLLKGSRK